jgi:hypothetical protein
MEWKVVGAEGIVTGPNGKLVGCFGKSVQENRTVRVWWLGQKP